MYAVLAGVKCVLRVPGVGDLRGRRVRVLALRVRHVRAPQGAAHRRGRQRRGMDADREGAGAHVRHQRRLRPRGEEESVEE